jgi:arsenite methyltransferase
MTWSRHPAALKALPSLADLEDGAGLKRCCATVYEHPAVRWLLGDELHPGGDATTLRALELAGVGPDDRLLDVASGHGASALLAAREVGCRVVGLEYGVRAVVEATAEARRAGLQARVSFRRGDAEALPFESDSFDAVLCECSLCTFPDKARAAGELRRVLRPGGRLALSDVVVDHSLLAPDLRGPLAVLACVGDALSRSGYERLLADAGLPVLAVERRDEDAAALARRVHDRLRGARLLGFERMAGAPLATAEAIELVASAREAIRDGTLGYAIFIAATDGRALR